MHTRMLASPQMLRALQASTRIQAVTLLYCLLLAAVVLFVHPREGVVQWQRSSVFCSVLGVSNL
jgi:hypothetical protein